MKEKQAITIYDIAQEAGVSTATVSRVLSGSASVSKARRDKVMELVEKYDFRPNALARGLSDARSKTIGIITADVRNPYYAEVFVACEEAAAGLDYTVFLGNTMNSRRQEIRQLEKFQEQRVEAVIQIGGSPDDLQTDSEYAVKVSHILGEIPIVVSGKLDGISCYRVSINEARCLELLMEHLLNYGHERIAMVGGRLNVLSTHNKYLRYREILEARGLPFCPELVLEGSYNAQSGYDLTNRLLETVRRPTAIIAINDYAAVGALKSLREHGLRVPEDISLVSYDNIMMAKLSDPPFTSIDYQYPLFGKMLVETAVAASRGEAVPQFQCVEPRLVIRQSAGPAPKA